MKIKMLLLPATAVSIFLMSCASNITSDYSISQKETLISADGWKVSSYNANGTDITADFAAYKFTFNNDGTVSATSDVTTKSGTWVVATINENPSSEQQLMLLINGNETLNELNETWIITSLNNTSMSLVSQDGLSEITFNQI